MRRASRPGRVESWLFQSYLVLSRSWSLGSRREAVARGRGYSSYDEKVVVRCGCSSCNAISLQKVVARGCGYSSFVKTSCRRSSREVMAL